MRHLIFRSADLSHPLAQLFALKGQVRPVTGQRITVFVRPCRFFLGSSPTAPTAGWIQLQLPTDDNHFSGTTDVNQLL